MSHHCCPTPIADDASNASQSYRRVLWLVLALNAMMFGIEVFAGTRAGSVALLSDSLDFLGDAANYGISLLVLSMPLVVRARASLLKAATMALFGFWLMGVTAFRLFTGQPPQYQEMGIVGLLALCVNVLCAWLLYAWRTGDSNMRGVWLCSRNDAIGNILVVLAAIGVYMTAAPWPDLLVAAILACLAIRASWQIAQQARGEINQ